MADIKRYDKLEHIENDPRNIKINFDEFSNINIKRLEIYNCELNGTINNNKFYFRGNIVMSTLNKLISQGTDLEKVDWKDSNLFECEFDSTSFDLGAIINCYFTSCNFQRCHYNNMSITGSSFYDTIFANCDLSHMVIENCKFFNCQFINCKTSNKLFEHCLIVESLFDYTDIQLQTITENFGIEKHHVINCKLRNSTTNENYFYIDEKYLEDILGSNNNDIQNIFKFKIEYYLNSNITLDGSYFFDSIFQIQEWLPLCKSQSTFINLFKLFHDFLMILFEANRTPLFIIMKFNNLTSWLLNQNVVKKSYELYPMLIGYRIGLTRILSQANDIIDSFCNVINKRIVLLVEGPLFKDYYYNNLKFYINGEFEITKLKEHNSPNILEIVGITAVLVQIVSLFIVTRVKVELRKPGKRKKPQKKLKKVILNDTSPYQLIKIPNKKSEDNMIQLYFMDPPQDIKLIKHSSQELSKARKILIEISI